MPLYIVVGTEIIRALKLYLDLAQTLQFNLHSRGLKKFQSFQIKEDTIITKVHGYNIRRKENTR